MLTSPPSGHESAPMHAANVAQLLSALIDCRPADAEAALLADRIVDDPQALAEYCEMIDLECLLAREFRSRAATHPCSASIEVP